MTKNEIKDILLTSEPKSMQKNTEIDIVWKKAKNDIIWDYDNKKYIDFTSTIFVQNFGHSNSRVKRYIKKQLSKNLLHTYIYPHETRAKFIYELRDLTGDDRKVFLLSSGTEATEAAMKLMKIYKKSKNIILSIKGSMHGRTMAASLAKGEEIYKSLEFVCLPYPNKEYNISKLVDMNKVAGIILETYQGWSARHLPDYFIEQIKKLKEKYKFLVCFDSIQAGLYRNGYLFGWEKYDIIPDLFCLGKGLAGGLPLSAVVGYSKIMDIPNLGDMSSTHSANPICCAAGLAILDEIKRIDVKKSFGLFGLRFNEVKARFSKIIIESNYSGMVGAYIFKNKEIADNICKKCLEKGLLLVHTGRESIKLGPPLTIKKKNILKGFSILEGVLDEL